MSPRAPRRWLQRALCAACLALAPGGCAPGVPADGPEAEGRVPGEYILTLAAETDAAIVRDAFRAHGLIELRPLFGRHYLLRLRPDPGLASVRARSPEAVLAVQPNYEYRPQ